MLSPYLLFLGDVTELAAAKTAAGILQWRPELCIGQIRAPGGTVDLGLPEMRPAEAAKHGARTMIIGIANAGGFIPDSWLPTILVALEAGLDIAAGMHTRLVDVPQIRETASRLGRTLHDVRQPTQSFVPGSGRKRSGLRLLTVGTDCAVGKKYAALAIEKSMRARGMKADFRATGQTGIFISGRGVAVDAVVADFISGAAEWLSPANDPDHWDVIEGQGSLFHPAYAGVTLGLIHGSQPDALVICHEPVRKALVGFDHYPVPALQDCIDATVSAARLTNPVARAVGISINTSRMSEQAASEAIARLEQQTGLPCRDPIRHGMDDVVSYIRKIWR
ncbi:MAG TPA: N-acetyltransferase DgcN [Steroidobacter sp.]|uniref:N-acetyltransferase DgcN n=1 Tax=Steroidobacter sp. TaxID=1978227 RepID=UPI002ED80B21